MSCHLGSLSQVIIAPITNVMSATPMMRLLFESSVPIPSPSGIIDISAPSWKKPIPIISIIAPTRNMAIVPISIGTRKILSTKTIAVIGRTADRASCVFSFSFGFIVHHRPFYSFQLNTFAHSTYLPRRFLILFPRLFMRKKMIILLTPCTISINAIEKAMIALESTGVNNSINPRIVPTIPKASSQPHCENPSDFSETEPTMRMMLEVMTQTAKINGRMAISAAVPRPKNVQMPSRVVMIPLASIQPER